MKFLPSEFNFLPLANSHWKFKLCWKRKTRFLLMKFLPSEFNFLPLTNSHWKFKLCWKGKTRFLLIWNSYCRNSISHPWLIRIENSSYVGWGTKFLWMKFLPSEFNFLPLTNSYWKLSYNEWETTFPLMKFLPSEFNFLPLEFNFLPLMNDSHRNIQITMGGKRFPIHKIPTVGIWFPTLQRFHFGIPWVGIIIPTDFENSYRSPQNSYGRNLQIPTDQNSPV